MDVGTRLDRLQVEGLEESQNGKSRAMYGENHNCGWKEKEHVTGDKHIRKVQAKRDQQGQKGRKKALRRDGFVEMVGYRPSSH